MQHESSNVCSVVAPGLVVCLIGIDHVLLRILHWGLFGLPFTANCIPCVPSVRSFLAYMFDCARAW